MLTPVTTATIATVITNTAAALTMIVIATLLVWLVNKELIANAGNVRATRLGQAFNIAGVPLLLVFVMTAVVQLIGALE